MSAQKRSQKLQEHLKNDHRIGVVEGSLKEIVYGGVDGIVTTFAVVCGFVGASSLADGTLIYPVSVVLLFGFANLFADGFSMGLGDFISSRSNKKYYEHEYAKELREIRNNPELEREETVEILTARGFSEDDAKALCAIYEKNESFWAHFMMQFELEMSAPRDENPLKGGLMTFGSFMVFGFIPLLPYVLGMSANPFAVSVIFTIAALILLGALRKSVTTEAVWQAIGEVVLIGSSAALIAYMVGMVVERIT